MTAPTANVTAMYFDQRCASSSASASLCLIARQLAISVMNAHDTPSGTRMMWNASVNAICDRAHGTGSTPRTGEHGPSQHVHRTGDDQSDTASEATDWTAMASLAQCVSGITSVGLKASELVSPR